jgi:hypothetical protein
MLRITSSLTAPLSSASDRGFDRFQTVGQHGCQYAHEAAVGFVALPSLRRSRVSAGGRSHPWKRRAVPHWRVAART